MRAPAAAAARGPTAATSQFEVGVVVVQAGHPRVGVLVHVCHEVREAVHARPRRRAGVVVVAHHVEAARARAAAQRSPAAVLAHSRESTTHSCQVGALRLDSSVRAPLGHVPRVDEELARRARVPRELAVGARAAPGKILRSAPVGRHAGHPRARRVHVRHHLPVQVVDQVVLQVLVVVQRALGAVRRRARRFRRGRPRVAALDVSAAV